MRLNFLLRNSRGEEDLKIYLPFLTEKCLETKKQIWCIASPDFDINPFGKLVKSPAKYHPKGRLLEHKKYYHGFFANLNCTEEFYNRYKKNLDKYIVVEKHIVRDSQPTWF